MVACSKLFCGNEHIFANKYRQTKQSKCVRRFIAINYSDRRLIPKFSGEKEFLSEDYGNVEKYPKFPRSRASGQGCNYIGTQKAVYEEIFDFTPYASLPGLGQSISAVVAHNLHGAIQTQRRRRNNGCAKFYV